MNFKEFLSIKNEVIDRHIDDIEEKLSELTPEELPHNELYGGKYRVVIPFDDEMVTRLKSLIQNHYSTTKMPELIEYEVDWINGQILTKFTNLTAGQTFVNKKTGKSSTAPKFGERKVKIAKFLENEEDKWIEEYPDMLDWWAGFMDTSAITAQEREIVAKNAGEYSIMFSRHPIDIMRMSDHQGITSCHDPNYGHGNFFHCAQQEAVDGGGVAYLVKTKDLEDVNLDDEEVFEDRDRDTGGDLEPISRVRLRRYTSKFPDEKTGDKFDFAVPETSIYGNSRIAGFQKRINRWLRDEQKDLIKRNGGREQFRSDNFVLRGGSYRDSDDGPLFNNFFNDAMDRGNTTHEFKGQESLVNMSEHYRTELEEMEETWNQTLKRTFVNYEEHDDYDDGGQFDYRIDGGINIITPGMKFLEQPDDEDIYESSKTVSLRDRLIEHGHDDPPISSDHAGVKVSGDNLQISIYTNDYEHGAEGYEMNDHGRDPNDFDNYADNMWRNYEENYEDILAITKDWLIERGFAENPPARELEEELWDINLKNFEILERNTGDVEELGFFVVQAASNIPIKTSKKLAGQAIAEKKYGGWQLKNQVDKHKMTTMIEQIKRAFLGGLQGAANHYDRQQWLPTMGKDENPYTSSEEGLPKIEIESDVSGNNLKINVEFSLHDDDSSKKVEATKRNLMTFDKSWSDLLQTAHQIIEKTLWSREEEERQAAQGDQQKLSDLLGNKARPAWPPQRDAKLFQEPPVEKTPEQLKSDDFRDKITKRGKYSLTPETPS